MDDTNNITPWGRRVHISAKAYKYLCQLAKVMKARYKGTSLEGMRPSCPNGLADEMIIKTVEQEYPKLTELLETTHQMENEMLRQLVEELSGQQAPTKRKPSTRKEA